MSSGVFRLLVVFEFLLLSGSLAATFGLEDRLPDPLQTYLDSQIDAPSLVESPLGFTSSLAVLMAALASYVGLLMFKNWGRMLMVITFVAGYALVNIDQVPVVDHAFANSLTSLATALSGFILAVAYLHEPIAERFRKAPLPDWTIK